MRPYAAIVATVATLAVAAPVTAADVFIRDIRLVGGVAASNYEADSNEADIDDGYRFGLMGMVSFGELSAIGGLAAGAEVNYLSADGDAADIDIFGVTVHAAWAFSPPLAPAFHIEGGAFAGLGQLKLAVENADSETGFNVEFGLRAGAYYTIGDTFQIGVDLRYLAASQAEIDIAGDETDLENDGLVALLSLGIRL